MCTFGYFIDLICFISQTVPNVAETRVLVAQKTASVPREPAYAGRRVSKNRTTCSSLAIAIVNTLERM